MSFKDAYAQAEEQQRTKAQKKAHRIIKDRDEAAMNDYRWASAIVESSHRIAPGFGTGLVTRGLDRLAEQRAELVQATKCEGWTRAEGRT